MRVPRPSGLGLKIPQYQTDEVGADIGAPSFAYFSWRRKKSESPSRIATVKHSAVGT